MSIEIALSNGSKRVFDDLNHMYRAITKMRAQKEEWSDDPDIAATIQQQIEELTIEYHRRLLQSMATSHQ